MVADEGGFVLHQPGFAFQGLPGRAPIASCVRHRLDIIPHGRICRSV